MRLINASTLELEEYIGDHVGNQYITNRKARVIEMQEGTVRVIFSQSGANGEQEISEQDVQNDPSDTDHGEFPGSSFVPQFGKGQGRHRIKGNNEGNEGNIFRMVADAYIIGDRLP